MFRFICSKYFLYLLVSSCSKDSTVKPINCYCRMEGKVGKRGVARRGERERSHRKFAEHSDP